MIMNCKKGESNGILDTLNYTAMSLMNGVPQNKYLAPEYVNVF